MADSGIRDSTEGSKIKNDGFFKLDIFLVFWTKKRQENAISRVRCIFLGIVQKRIVRSIA